jgi:hypothetical protein
MTSLPFTLDPSSKIVPADATIADLEERAAEYERKAEQESVSAAAQLREQAKQCRAWIAALKTGKWIP